MDYPEPSDGPTDDATCLVCGRYPYWPVKHGDGWLCGECAADGVQYGTTPPPRHKPKYPTYTPLGTELGRGKRIRLGFGRTPTDEGKPLGWMPPDSGIRC